MMGARMKGHPRRGAALSACALSLLSAGVLTATTAFAAGPWTQQATLIPRDIAGFDHIGFTLSLSHDGQTALIGAPSHNSYRGVAYVFVHHPSGWVQQAKIKAADQAHSIFFGWAVAISDDGNTAVVGAPDNDLQIGAVYVFSRSGYQWAQVAKFTSREAPTFSEFGSAVAVSHDGKTIVVGAPQQNSEAGATYVFVRSGTTWVQKAKLTVSDAPAFLGFGFSVAMGQDGQELVVGAPYTGVHTGAAYIFTRTGSRWIQSAQLTGRFSGANFGRSVDISHDGDVALIGAPESNVFSGEAYVFDRSGSQWIQSAELTGSPNTGSFEFFGFSVALGHDAESALIGAPDYNGYIGAAYYLTRSGTTWTQKSVLTADGGLSGDNFGFTVALARDRAIALIGADNRDLTTGQIDAGSAYIFDRA